MRVPPWEDWSFTVEVLEYHRGGTGVFPWKYWSTTVEVLEFFRGSTGISLRGCLQHEV